MALNPDRHNCPIFNEEIEDGLCWEICFADSLIAKEAVTEIMEYSEKNKMSVEELQEKFCKHCQFCQWYKPGTIITK